MRTAKFKLILLCASPEITPQIAMSPQATKSTPIAINRFGITTQLDEPHTSPSRGQVTLHQNKAPPATSVHVVVIWPYLPCEFRYFFLLVSITCDSPCHHSLPPPDWTSPIVSDATNVGSASSFPKCVRMRSRPLGTKKLIRLPAISSLSEATNSMFT